VNILANDFCDQLESYSLTVVPLFVFMGQLAFNAGIAKRLYDSAHKFLGHVPAGLALATVVGATIFKAISGSVVATSATFASVAVPEMSKFGYSKKLSTGIVATVGTLGVIIPPSVTLIILGILTTGLHRKTLLAGVNPRFNAGRFFFLCDFGMGSHKSIDRTGMREIFMEGTGTFSPCRYWPIVIFLVVIGGLMYGFFTPRKQVV